MGAPVRILHLDDNPFDAQLVSLWLETEQERLPTTVTYVSTKEEYLAALERKDFDIILSDYRMPAFDGDQALKAAREKCPEIPFIMVTGELGEDLVIETLHRGATDYVLKDRMFRLIPSIERALAEADLERKRREAEEDAREAHRATAETLESIQDPFFSLDREWRFTFVNRRAEEFMNRSREELLGNVIWELWPNMRGAESERNLRSVMETRKAVHYEGRSVLKNIWIDVHISPGADGGLSVLYRDISERKANEVALRLSEERFASTFRASPYPLALSRLSDGKFFDVNDALLALYGAAREEVVGKTSLELGIWVGSKGSGSIRRVVPTRRKPS